MYQISDLSDLSVLTYTEMLIRPTIDMWSHLISLDVYDWRLKDSGFRSQIDLIGRTSQSKVSKSMSMT